MPVLKHLCPGVRSGIGHGEFFHFDGLTWRKIALKIRALPLFMWKQWGFGHSIPSPSISGVHFVGIFVHSEYLYQSKLKICAKTLLNPWGA